MNFKKVLQKKPVDFELRDEILERALKNRPKDFMHLESEMKTNK